MTPHCHIHQDQKLLCPRCVGAKGGKHRSPAKARAARANAKLGGRPRQKRRKGS